MRPYELLLHLYPAAFRIEYGDELRRVFAHRRADTSGTFGLTWLWMEVIKDTFLNAIAVYWDILRQDLPYTARTLGRARGFAMTAILVTGLGVGANTAVFSITDHVLIRPLPFADSDRLVKLWEHPPGYARMELSSPNYRDWRDRSVSFEEMGAYHAVSANLVGIGDPETGTGH